MSKKRDYKEIEAEFEQALRMRDEGKLAEAEELLLNLAERYPEAAFIQGILGDIQERRGRIAEAAASYRRATERSSASEVASISLFHALYQLGDLEGALAEMRRFRRRGAPSPMYDELIRDLKVGGAEE